MTERYIIENFIIYYTSDEKEREQMRQTLNDYLKTELTEKIIFTYTTEDIDTQIERYKEDEPELAKHLISKKDEMIEQILQNEYMYELINESIGDIVYQHAEEYRQMQKIKVIKNE